MTKQELEKIYEDNQQLELDVRIVGNRAKKLINNSKRALDIIHNEIWSAYLECELRQFLKELEDGFIKNGFISATDYNMGVRGKIHVAITRYDKQSEYKKWGWKTECHCGECNDA